MTIPANIDELEEFKPWKDEDILEYEKFISEKALDFRPKITIDADVATIEHIAVFFHNRIVHRTVKVYYNAVDKKIDKFEFGNVDMFTFTPHFRY